MPIAIAFVLATLLAACTNAPVPIAAHDAADPQIAVPPIRYSSAIDTYRSQRPVDPLSWREQNERVAPRPKQ